MVKVTVSIECDTTDGVVDAVKKSMAAVAEIVQEQPPVIINNLLGDSVHDASGSSTNSADNHLSRHDS